MNKESLLAELLARASSHYTAGSQRQVIHLAEWLLSDFRTEEQLVERLQFVIDEIYPPRREDMLKKALEKISTPEARRFIKGCREPKKQTRPGGTSARSSTRTGSRRRRAGAARSASSVARKARGG